MKDNRKITRDEFECARAAIWECGMSNFRYKMYDLGGILLRNDADASRRKQWKDEVSDWLYSAIDHGLQEKFDPETPISNLVFMIRRFWSEAEYWLIRLGKAALDEDQYSYYKTRLNNLLYKYQKDTASYLYNGSIREDDGKDSHDKFNPQNVNLIGLSWSNNCCAQGEYTFSVETHDLLCCPDKVGAQVKSHPVLGAYCLQVE